MKKNVRRLAVAVAVCASFVAGPAHAQYYYGGLKLAWNDCAGTGTQSLFYECGSDTSALKLYGSFVAPPGLDAVVGYKISVVAQGVGQVPWWDYGAGGCREGLWRMSANLPGAGCTPVGTALTSNQTFDKFVGPFDSNVKFSADVSFLEAQAITEGQEFYAFTLTLRRPSPSACDGCCFPTCLLALVEFHQESGFIQLESDFNDAATWQGGVCGVRQAVAVTSGGSCLPTPAKSSTWGSLKVLYR